MSIPNQVRTNQSIAYEGPVLNAPNLKARDYKPERNYEKIKDYLDSKNKLGNLQFPLDIPQYHFRMEFSDYKRESMMKVAATTKRGSIILPMPYQIIDAHQVRWEQEQLGILLGGGLHGATSLYNRGNGDVNSRMSNLQDLQKKVTGWDGIKDGAAILGGAAATGAAALAVAAAPQVVVDGVSAAVGIAPNQFLTVLFKGPSYKEFTLQWKLSPNNKKESEELWKIIKQINREMAPSTYTGSLFFSYPSVVTCSFSNKGQMYEFKPAVIKAFGQNYTGSGMPAFYHTGYPESVEFSIQFMELEFWLKNDFEGTTF
jgi:hypothetical protein